MLLENFVPKHLWVEAVSTACYVQNRILIRPILDKTLYELWKGSKTNISHFKPFGCECYILNTKDQIGKFDSKVDKEIFLGYSNTSRRYRVYDSITLVVEESVYVRFNDGLTSDRKLSKPDDDLVDLQSNREISFEDPKVETKSSQIT